MTRRALFPTTTPASHRPLVCTRCGTLVGVLEIPAGHLDEDEYVCGDCLTAGKGKLPDARSASEYTHVEAPRGASVV